MALRTVNVYVYRSATGISEADPMMCPHCGCLIKTPHRRTRESFLEAFWRFVEIRGEDECWPWKGPLQRKGYPSFSYQGKRYRGNRVAFEIGHAKELGELYALHDCDNPWCCNPKHLHAGDNTMNLREMTERGRRRSGSCPGTKNGRALINETMVREIRATLARGVTIRETAALFGIGHGIVSNISCGRAWVTIT